MSVWNLECAKRLRKAGEVLRREGLSSRAASIMVEYVTKTGSYKEAMRAAGRLKAIAAAAQYDAYWKEQVDEGFHREMLRLEDEARKLTTKPASEENAA